MPIHHPIYDLLKEVARAEKTINYASIAPLADLNMESQADRNEIGRILDDINLYEHENNRPMLSAVVIREGMGYPGRGFFELARQLGLHHRHNNLGDLEFFVNELNRVYAYWQEH